MRALLSFGLLAHSALAYNRQNRLVRVWDNLAIYDDQGVLQGTFNMTSFPYIQNVSGLLRSCVSVPNQQDRQRAYVLLN